VTGGCPEQLPKQTSDLDLKGSQQFDPWVDCSGQACAFSFSLCNHAKACGLEKSAELLSNLVFEFCWSCGDLAGFGGFNTVFERDACDDFGEVVKAA